MKRKESVDKGVNKGVGLTPFDFDGVTGISIQSSSPTINSCVAVSNRVTAGIEIWWSDALMGAGRVRRAYSPMLHSLAQGADREGKRWVAKRGGTGFE